MLEIVERTVKPERDTQKRPALRERWWQYAEKRPGLRSALSNVTRVLVNSSKATPHHAFTFLPLGLLYTQNLNVLTLESYAAFCAVQSRPHEIWARSFGTTFEDRLTYTKDDCFDTFPMPDDNAESAGLSATGASYEAHRSNLMIKRNGGMTKTYNRFHDPAESSEDIRRLRELHHDLDCAMLRAYGWDDLAVGAAPVHLTADDEPDHQYQGRLFWPAPFRDEVLARLLDFNRARADEERALGLSPLAAHQEDEDPEAA